MKHAALLTSVCLLLCPIFGNARIGMTATELTQASFDGFVTDNPRMVVDFYDPEDSAWAKDQKELESALVAIRNIGHATLPIAKVDVRKEPELGKKYVPNARYPQLVWFAHGKATQYHRTLRSSKMITDFVAALDRPAIAEVTSSTQAADYNQAVFAEIPKDPKSTVYKALEAVAQRHMDTVAITFMNSQKNTVSWMKDGKVTVQYTGDVTNVDALDLWVKEQLPLKSEAVPEGELAVEDGSRVVVGRNFEQVVLQQDKDVLLLVHAPWCGYCKKLLPKWRQLARYVADIPHLDIAMIDGDRNQSPLPNDFAWNAYPTILHVRAGEKSPTTYRGDRTAEAMLDFAKEHSTFPSDFERGNVSDSSIADL